MRYFEAIIFAAICSLSGACAGTVGTANCPGDFQIVDCPEGQTKVCETTEKGRCCGCDTPRQTGPAERNELP